MSEGKIIFTEDVLDKVAEEKGYDRKLLEKLYFHCTDTLEKETKKGEFLAFQLPFLGTLYLTIKGANFHRNLYRLDMLKYYKYYKSACKSEGREEYKRFLERKLIVAWEKLEFYDRCIEKALNYTKWLKENGQKRVAYLELVRNTNRIINR